MTQTVNAIRLILGFMLLAIGLVGLIRLCNPKVDLSPSVITFYSSFFAVGSTLLAWGHI